MGELQRTQVLLEKWQHERLRLRAEEEGVSMSELLRNLLEKDLEPERSDKVDRLRRIRGAGRDEDIPGKEHDEAIYAEGS